MTSCIIVLWLTTFVVLASSEPQFPYYSGYFGPHSTSFQRWHPYQQGMQMSPFIPVMVMHPFPQHQQYPSSIPIRDSISGAQSPLQSVFPFFWNPFSVSQPQPFGSTRISYRQNNCESNLETGTCYTRQECRDRKGSIGQGLYCRDFTKTCCISHHTCGDSTNVPSSYFRSKNWPLRSTISSSCKFVVNKDTNICAVRINFKSLALPASIGYCDGIGIEATGTDQALMPLCGPLSGKSYDIEFKNSDSISLDIKTVQTFKLYWNIHVTQVKCSENLKTTWPSKGSSEPVQTTNFQIPETKPVVVKPVSTVVKPPPPTLTTQPKCGASKVKRKSFGHPTFRIRDYGQVPQQIHECIDHSGVNSCSPDDPSSPILNSLDWEVPMVNNSIFFKIAGPPHIQSVRITYGRKTQPHEYPWAVAMYSNGRFHCGASLISDQHVLTAAHCVIRKKSFPASLQLSIGDWDINSKADGPSLKRNIKHIATHPGYSTVTLKYDVAVLTLSEKVTFTDFIQPVCLPSTDSALSDDLVTVIGWGRDEKNRLQSTLMEHEASLVSNDLCNTRWQKKGAPAGIIAPTMLCMDPQSGDSCKGDSGGPLIMPDAEGKFQQIGIVSFGSASCTDPNLPGVYTNVGKMINWIKEEMDKKH